MSTADEIQTTTGPETKAIESPKPKPSLDEILGLARLDEIRERELARIDEAGGLEKFLALVVPTARRLIPSDARPAKIVSRGESGLREAEQRFRLCLVCREERSGPKCASIAGEIYGAGSEPKWSDVDGLSPSPCDDFRRYEQDEDERLAGIPARYRGLRLQTYRARDESQTKAVIVIADAVRKFRPGRGSVVVLRGAPGRGKTHLAAAACAEFRRRGIYAKFAHVPSVLERLKRSIGTESESSGKAAVEDLAEADAVVLDDLGIEADTEWSRGTVGQIIADRDAEGRLTIITTALGPEDMARRYGLYVASRLIRGGEARWVDLSGADHRAAR